MAQRTKEELKSYFETGDTPTQQQFADLIDSLSPKDWLEFTGRFYLYTNNRWIGTSTNYAQAYCNHYQNHGTGENPSVIWNSLGIGFLPKGTILHSLEFIGRVNSAQVTDIQVQLSCQGSKLNDGGYKTITNAENKIILNPTNLGYNDSDSYHMQRHLISLDDYVLDEDRIIEFCSRPVGSLTTTRYWIAQRKLHYTSP